MEHLEKLSFDFFKLFSRLEYSLKAASFNTGDGNANANWSKFAQSIDTQFLGNEDKELKKAYNYVLENPPKKQIIEKGLIKWLTIEPTHKCQTDLVLLYVRRVRNNLFHGGKFNGNWFAPQRSEELLSNSITILENVRKINDKVKQAFDFKI
ncbi:hypothetical protein [Photobacterium carnosum]|uniref:hypothetical protein n=1 Tax=Photobacterium carnosum TaxID=2023717 RepID=UPI001E3E3320|nr:hypothetical protein [Photobacterium carnosum]MCD9515566.1 hypothetical protein [Photobacterium carnosum]